MSYTQCVPFLVPSLLSFPWPGEGGGEGGGGVVYKDKELMCPCQACLWHHEDVTEDDGCIEVKPSDGLQEWKVQVFKTYIHSNCHVQ